MPEARSKYKLGVSLITMDHLNFQSDLKILERSKKIDYIHVDAMDGQFVPRYGIYPEITQKISQLTDLPLDLHLMVKDVDFAISQFCDLAKFETISFHHYTNEGRIFKIIDKIHAVGAKPVLVADLSSDINHINNLLQCGSLQGVMFMGIHPGVLKQTPRPDFVKNNVRKVMEYCQNFSLPAQHNLQVDGAFNFDTANSLLKSGINNFVGGTSSILSGLEPIHEFEARNEKILNNLAKLEERFDA